MSRHKLAGASNYMLCSEFPTLILFSPLSPSFSLLALSISSPGSPLSGLFLSHAPRHHIKPPGGAGSQRPSLWFQNQPGPAEIPRPILMKGVWSRNCTHTPTPVCRHSHVYTCKTTCVHINHMHTYYICTSIFACTSTMHIWTQAMHACKYMHMRARTHTSV